MWFYSSVTPQVSSLNPLYESSESESDKTNDVRHLITSSAPVRQIPEPHPQLCFYCLGLLVFYTVVKLTASLFV